MKKTTLILWILVLAATSRLMAQNAPITTAGNVITTGTSVVLPITVSNFSNIAACDLKLLYNPAIATVTAVTAGSAISGPNTGMNYNITVPGSVNFGWFATPGRTVPDNTVVFNIYFTKVTDGVCPVTWSTVGFECEYYDGSYNTLIDNPLSSYYTPGSVIFQGSAPITSIMPLTACIGSNISVPVEVSDFNAIGAVSLTINYDDSVLDFLPGENTSGYPGLSINNTAPGTIIIGGFSSSPVGETYPDNTTLATLNFHYKGGSTALSFYDSDGSSCEFTGPLGSPTLTDSPQSTYYINGLVSGYPTPTLVSATATDALCHGGNGTINIEYTGGTGTLHYTIGSETNTTGIFTRPANTYTYSVSDASGCPPVTATVTVGEPTDLTATKVEGTILCNGGSTTVTITANGGTAPYTGDGVHSVSAGPYSFTVTDANNCSVVVAGNISQPALLTATAAEGSISCFGGSTTVTITATGGIPPYSGDGVHTVSAGPYSFTITDANNCSVVVAGNISQPDLLTASAIEGTISCFGGSTTVTITAAGGTAPYSGDGVHTVSAGPYSFTVTDANNCSVVVSGSISQPTALSASAVAGNSTCGNANGSVNLSVIGGTASYSFAWSNGANTEDLTNVPAGLYSVTVTDGNGCTATASATVNDIGGPTASINAQTNVACFGNATGSATVIVSGGTPEYTYLWDDPAGQTTATANGLAAGTYSVTVSDANNCNTTVTVIISQPDLLTATAVEGTIPCFGGSTTVTITATGGTPPYSGDGVHTVSAGPYSFTVTDVNNCSVVVSGNISQPNLLTASAVEGTIPCFGGSTTVTITATGGTPPYSGDGVHTVSAGPYSFNVTDANNCSVVVSGNISQPNLLTASAVEGTIPCFGGSTTVTITATGGTPPYSGDGVHSVSAGPYSFTVTDANNCSVVVAGNISQPALLTATAAEGSISCFGGSTTVTITATGGIPPYSGDGVHTVSAGPYSFTVTDANNCSVVVAGNISQPALLTATAAEGSISCFGGSTTVTITATGGTPPYSGDGAHTVSAGPYSFTVTDANNCSVVVAGNISQPDLLTASAIEGTISCFGGSTTVTITTAGGTAPYSGDGVHTVSAGPYSFTVTDANNCSVVVSGNISQPNLLTASAVEGTIPCFGGSTTVTITATGGTPPYSGDGAHTVSVGPYSFTVTDVNNCSVVVAGNISQPAMLTATAAEGSISCFGGSTTVTITATGGTPPYSGDGVHSVSAGPYSFSVTDANNCSVVVTGNISQPAMLTATAAEGSISCFGGSTTVTITATGGIPPYSGDGVHTVSAGPYSFTVTDANNCSVVVAGNISQPALLTATAAEGSISCFGGSTTVTITATGGTPPYSGNGVHSVSAGPYSFTVTDANNCSVVVAGNISQPALLTATAAEGSISCFGGSTNVTITATGGTPPYSGDGVHSVSAGPYSFTITDANNCSVVVAGNISQPALLTATAAEGSISCFGGSTTVTITATGGTPPYSGDGVHSVSAGPYSFTVTDANNCSVVVSGNISQPNLLTATAIEGTIPCFGGSTTVTITATGGTPPYSGNGVHIVSAGPYSFTVTDANNCSVVVAGNISQPALLTATAAEGSISCFGGSTTVTITATGGTHPYSGDGAHTVSAGPYSFTVTDVNNCSVVVAGNISQPDLLTASAIEGTISCFGGSTTVTINAAGGTAPYSGDGVHTVSAGPYSFTVTDINNCSVVVSGSISQPNLLTATAVEGTIPCFGGSTTVTITATGGTPPYSGNGVHIVSAGPYSFTVTDANNCSVVVSGSISQPNLLTATAVEGTIPCFGGSTTVTITATGGTPPYSGDGVHSVSAGPYSFSVTDANNCSVVVAGNISQPNLLTASAVEGTIPCFGGSTTVTITATGGTPPYSGDGVHSVSAGPYSFTVTDINNCSVVVSGSISQPNLLTATAVEGTIPCFGGSTTVTITATGGTPPYSGDGVHSVSAGPYSFTVTDANNCSVVVAGNISQPALLTATAAEGSISCFGGSTTVTINAAGGTAPYSGDGVHTVSAGPYSFTVTDANNCSVVVSGNISQPDLLTASAIEGTISCFGGSTTVTITAAGGTAPYSGDGVHTVSAGPYSFTVTDANNCSVVVAGNISQPALLTATAAEGSISCFGGSTTVTITATGGTPPYSGDGVHSVSAGPYSFTVTDANNCSVVVAGNISQPALLTATAAEGSISCFGGSTTVTITATGGIPPYSGDGVHTVSAGPYSFTVTDANNCSVVVAGNISQPALLTATAAEGSISCFGGSTTVTITATGGTPPYSGNGVHSVSAGPYSFTITDANNCSVVVAGNISQPALLTATAAEGSISCFGGSTTVTITATGGTPPYSGDGVHSVSAGPYSFTVTDANNCSVVVSGNISQPNLLTATAIEGTIPCFGGSTTVTITATGGTPPYSGNGVHIVSAGPYSFTVTDANNCSVVVAGNISQPALLTATAAEGSISCFGGSTTLTITATGGTPPYSGDGVHSVSAGPYSFTVTDINNCSVVVSGSISQPNLLTATAVEGTIPCFGGSTTVTITATGGTPPYSGDGAHTVSAGPYSFTVTDANNCSVVVAGNISQPALLTATAAEGSISCFGGSTTVTITATGGTPPYSGDGVHSVSAGPYSFTVTDINNCSVVVSGSISQPNLLTATAVEGTIPCFGGSTTVTITATGGTPPYSGNGVHTVSAGPYSFTVTDANNCSVVVAGNISQPALLTATAAEGSISCFGGSTTVTITATGGTPPYSGDGAHTVSAGPYSFTVTDVNNCSVVVSGSISQPALLTATAAEGSISCFGGSTTVTITATGGTSPYSGDGVHTVSAGPYSFTVTDANNCSVVVAGNISQPTALSASAVAGNSTCGNANGSVNLTVTGGTASYSFAWSNGASTEDLTNVAAGLYSVTVTDSNGCTATASATVNDIGGPSASITAQTNVACFGNATGSATVTVSGGTPEYTYLWDDPASQTTATATGLAAGTYNVIVTDDNGCVATAQVIITQPTAALAASATPVSSTCGNDNGSVNLSVTGGAGSYTFAWSNGATTEDLTNVSAGTYSVIVTDGNGCTATASATVNDIGGPSASITAQTDVACFGNATGSATVTVSGGTPEYTYLWDDPATQTTATATGLAAGTYNVTVTDDNGCIATAQVIITQPTAALAASATPVSSTCGNDNGSVNLSVTGGAGSYTFAWSNGATTEDLTNVSAGTYSVIVTDGNGCTATASATVNDIGGPSASIDASTNVACFGNATGSATVTVSGGTPEYTYLWDDPATQTTATANGLAAGTYNVTVTDDNGCIATAQVIITQPSAALAASATPVSSTCGNDNGSVNLTVTGGTASYTFAWSNGATTEDLTNVSAGTYSVIVTDGNGCTATASATVNDIGGPSASITAQTDVACFGNATGSATVTVSGGTPEYTYLWDDPATQTTATANGLAAGTYNVTVTDDNGCIATAQVIITQPTAALAASATPVSSTCGNDNGSVNLTVTGGTASYTFAWSNGATTEDLTNVSAGTYSVIVTDGNGCTATASATVNDIGGPSASITAQTDVACFGNATGSATVTVSGGTPEYSYLWDDPATQTTATATGLVAGTYNVIVTDDNGCTATAQVIITQPTAALAASATPVSSTCGNDNGSVNLSVTGGAGSYTFAWSNGATTEDLTNVSAGTYSVIVTDGNGCTATASATVNDIGGPSASITAQTNVACFGNATGSATVTVSGGTPEYAYLWDDPATQTTATATGLAAGTYDVTVTDDNGCIATAQVIITQPTAALAASATPVSSTCGNDNGSVNLSVTGGAGSYTFAWSNGATTEDLTNVSAGTYSVIVTDGNGCTATASATVNDIGGPSASITAQTDVACFGNATGSATVTVSGGTPEYSYLWDDLATQMTATATGLAAGTYNVIVTDDNGCIATAQVIITQPTAALAASATPVSSTCGNANGSVNLSVTGGAGSYTFAWSNGATTEDLTNVPAGLYSVTVTDGNGCTATASATVNDIGGPTASITAQTNVACFGNATGSATVTVSGGTPEYTYLWDDPATQTTATATGLAAGTYNVIITDDNGCIATAQVIISQPTAITLLTASTVNPTCYGGTGTITLLASGGTGALSYTIGSETNNTGVFNRTSGSYTYNITDENGCGPLTGSIMVADPDQIVLVSETVTDPHYEGDNGTITLAYSGGTGTLHYTIGAETNTTGIFIRPTGSYAYSVTDDNDCEVTGNVVVGGPTHKLLSINVFIEGFYDFFTNSMVSPLGDPGGNADYITVELHNSGDYTITEYVAADVFLKTDGTISVDIPAEYDESYYLTIEHRNCITTVSALPVSFASGSVNYDFTDAPSKAYGNNMIQVNIGVWAIYSGDVNKDGIVDTADMTAVDNDNYNYATGYLNTDINGTGYVDTSDMSFVDNNSNAVVMIQTP